MRLQDTSIVEAKLSSRGSTPIASMYQTLSYASELSSKGNARQCTNSDGDNVAPCLLRRLATPYLLKGLATSYLLRRLATSCLLRRLVVPYLLRGLATPHPLRRLAAPYLLRGLATPHLLRRLTAPYLLRGLATPYLLRRHYSLVIASGPEVAFVTPAIPVDRSNMEVIDRTASPAPAGTAIPRVFPEEIAVTRPDRKVVTKADHAAKRKASNGPEISTNAAKKTRSSKKGSGAGSSGQAVGYEVEQTDDGTLDDDNQRDGLEFAMEGIELNDVNQDVTYPPILLLYKEVEAYAELSEGVIRATRSSFRVSHGVSEDAYPHTQEAVPAPDTQPLDVDAGTDEIASNGNVDPYYEARVGNTAGDVLERDLLPFVPVPYYIPYPYDDGSGSESPPYTKDDWEEIHGVNLGLQKKELYKDPKVCRTALDRFPTPTETHRNIKRRSKQCAQQTQTIKRQSADLKQQNESTVRANEEVSRLTAKLGVLKSRCQAAKHKLSSWDKKHRKYRNERDTLAMEKAKIEEELVGTKSQLENCERQAEEIHGSIASFFQSDFTPLVRRFLKSGEFNRAFAGVLNTTVSVGVERGLRIDRTDEEFRGLSQRFVGFIPDAKEKFDRVVATFPDTTFLFLDKLSQNSQSSLQDIARLEPDRVTSSHQTSSATASLRANTHVRHSTSSPGTFGHTSTLEHLKKKKKPVEKGGPSTA
ncbi:hypothetical protein Tco_1254110 [Tanacetum coccineum]